MKNNYQSVMQLLSCSKLGIKNIPKQAKQLAFAQKIICDALPATIANQLFVSRISNSCLSLTCQSASIATRVRMLSSDVLKKLHQEDSLQSILHIQCKVGIDTRRTAPTKKPTRPATSISTQSKKSIEQLAITLPDEELKSAVMKLIKTDK
jgi:hypothetical protein